MTATIALLVTVSPLSAVLPLCAVVPVLLERAAQSAVEGARERAAERLRLAKHLLELATSAGPVRELRVFGAEGEILRRQRDAWDKVTSAMWHAQLKAAAYRAAGQGFFALGYAGAIAGELYRALHGHASAGDLVLVITLAVQVSVQVSGALSVLSLLQVAARTIDRIAALRALAAAPLRALRGRRPRRRGGPRRRSWRLTRGITLEDVSFCYPGAERPVLSGVSVHIPAGSVLALAGENGAGKSTLVKLLCGLYQPTSGRILIDGQDLAGLDPADWRSRVAALFQDFHRIELTLGESIGHGDIGRAGDTGAVRAAAEKARAEPVLRAVPGGLAGYVGHSYADGTELSGGQWQTVGLARALMRQPPPAADPRRARRGSRRRRRARPVRALCRLGRAGRAEDGGITVLDLPPLLHRAHGRPHRRPRPGAAHRVRHPPRAHGRPRAVRRAVHPPGPRLPVARFPGPGDPRQATGGRGARPSSRRTPRRSGCRAGAGRRAVRGPPAPRRRQFRPGMPAQAARRAAGERRPRQRAAPPRPGPPAAGSRR